MTSGTIYVYIPRKETRLPSSRPSHQQMRIWHCMYYEPTSRWWYGMLLTSMVRQMWILKITDGKSRMACPCLWHTMARLHPQHNEDHCLWLQSESMCQKCMQLPGCTSIFAQLIANATLETTAKISWLYTRICLITATLMLNSFHTSSNTVCVSWNVLPLRCLGIWYCYPYGSWLKSITALHNTCINSDIGMGLAASHHNLYGCFWVCAVPLLCFYLLCLLMSLVI